jgi:hypothetical protein
MKNINLGTLQKVEIREIWEHEATEFTPWLAKQENIDMLGSAIGLDLIVEAEEKDVGPFRADILCKDVATNNLVLIENQLERTDHKHLGQLLTYATGLNAVSIIWIAAEFNEEHRATLDWLNKITGQEYNFFGVQIELYKIGNSQIAPDFTVVSKPNNWSRIVSSNTSKMDYEDLGPTKIKQLHFWTRLCEDIKEKKDSPLRVRKPRPQHWHNFAIGASQVNLASTFNTKEEMITAEVYIINNKEIFKELEKNKESIEKEFGEELEWQLLPDRAASRIKIIKTNCDLENEDNWEEYVNWLIGKLEKLYYVFNKRLADL